MRQALVVDAMSLLLTLPRDYSYKPMKTVNQELTNLWPISYPQLTNISKYQYVGKYADNRQ